MLRAVRDAGSTQDPASSLPGNSLVAADDRVPPGAEVASDQTVTAPAPPTNPPTAALANKPAHPDRDDTLTTDPQSGSLDSATSVAASRATAPGLDAVSPAVALVPDALTPATQSAPATAAPTATPAATSPTVEASTSVQVTLSDPALAPVQAVAAAAAQTILLGGASTPPRLAVPATAPIGVAPQPEARESHPRGADQTGARLRAAIQTKGPAAKAAPVQRLEPDQAASAAEAVPMPQATPPEQPALLGAAADLPPAASPDASALPATTSAVGRDGVGRDGVTANRNTRLPPQSALSSDPTATPPSAAVSPHGLGDLNEQTTPEATQLPRSPLRGQTAPVTGSATLIPAPALEHKVTLRPVEDRAEPAQPQAETVVTWEQAAPTATPAAVPATIVTAATAPAHQSTPVEQVAPALLMIAKASNGSQQMTVRLQPVELGLVEVKIARDASGSTQIEITAEKSSTLLAIQRDQPQLHRTLDEAGIPATGRTVTFHALPPAQAAANSNGSGFSGGQASGQ
ncbi:MAG: flagellar hook-length control protein FliK, partial [Acetobacteraceae bacterium]|nr:flagellar hook-length control protein FliK [Acetobacteraceae bacterium]